MSGSSKDSNPRSPRPVAMVRRHGALIVATGSLLVGLIVLTGIALDGTRAEGEPSPGARVSASVDLVDIGEPGAPAVVTDVLGERAAELTAFLDAAAAAEAAARRPAATASRRAANVVSPDDPTVWDQLAHCETGGNWAMDHVPGFAGGLGFANGTWTANGGDEFAASAADATREQQIVIAERVLAGSGWGAWPGCSSLMGLR